MNFIVFPGQGSQKISMGKDLSDNFVEAKEVFEEVNEALDFNLTEIMWGDDEKTLSLTNNAQPALMACGVASFRVLKKLTGKNLPELANYLCGHSLGEYTAMTVAGVFSLKECSQLLRLRGNAMQKAVPIGKGAMAAFIGADISTTKLVETISAFLGVRPRIFYIPIGLLFWLGRLFRKLEVIERLTDSLQVDSTLIREELDWSPPFTVEEGLERTAQWFNEHRRYDKK